MIINIPESFRKEREYILNVVFRDFLGVDFQLGFHSLRGYSIILENQNYIFVEDCFFSFFDDGPDYLNIKNIPAGISYSVNQFTSESDIPVIYGTPEVIVEGGSSQNIRCKIDIFSSIFFMLTRWEEYVTAEKDEFGRFPEVLSFAIKYKIHRRPVVNEYIEMLWNMLLFLGYQGERKKHEFSPVITHDVDEIIRFKNFFRFLRAVTGDLLLRRRPSLVPSTIKEYTGYKTGKLKDSFDTFDYLMGQSESLNTKSIFYFLAQKNGFMDAHASFDFRYDIHDPKVNSVIRNILSRGHHIGIHGSYYSADDNLLLSSELRALRSITGSVSESRQHYLRFTSPATWLIAEESHIEVDSTLGFADDFGFRCGTCYPYHVFDFMGRTPLKLIERPLIAMDSAVILLSKNQEDFYNQVISMVDVVKKYNGTFTLLWHTNSFNSFRWKQYEGCYPQLISYIAKIKNLS